MIVYKITNLINNKVYIGLTTTSLATRWSHHLSESRNINNTKPLYRAIRKYGEENFLIEAIEETDDIKLLGQLEREYIQKYNSTNLQKGYNLTAGGERNQWDANPAAKLSYDEVINIRKIYGEKTLSLRECWKLYQNKISLSAFQKIWLGVTWPEIMPEVYTEQNKAYHNKQKSNPGSKNGNAIFSEEQVFRARLYYVSHSLNETYIKYGKGYSKDGFRGVLTRTFSHIPIYKKTQKVWILNNRIIDIDSYKPVSTILETEE